MKLWNGWCSAWLVLFLLVLAPSCGAGEHKDWSHKVVLPHGEKSVDLFNGHDLTGWKGMEKYFSVVDHQIRAANEKPVPSSTYLLTERKYREYRLLFELKQTMGEKYSKMHSAIATLGEHKTDDIGGFGFRGLLLMLCDDWGIWDAHGRNRIYPPGQVKPLNDVPWEKKGKWNQVEVLVLGNRVRVVCNGQLAMDYTEKETERLKDSPIGLQLHNNKEPQEYHFRGLVLVEKPIDELVTLKK